MPTSGSYTYQVTALQVINAAAEDIGIRVAGQALGSADLATALTALNMLVKQWQGTSDKFPGLKEWTRQRVTVFLAKNQMRYLVGPNSTDSMCCLSTAYGRTTVRTTSAAATTALPIVATSDATTNPGTTISMANADNIGIRLDDGTIQWTTISSTGAGPIANLGAGLTSQASAGNYVYWFTNKAQRFVDTEAAVYRDENLIDLPLRVFTDVQEYEGITQKNAAGDPTGILIEYQRLNTAVTCNFSTANTQRQLRLTVFYPAEDYTSAAGADDISYPQEFYAALEWELARRIAPKFGAPWSQDMQMNWQINVQDAIGLNPQNSSAYFEPGREMTDTGSPFSRP